MIVIWFSTVTFLLPRYKYIVEKLAKPLRGSKSEVRASWKQTGEMGQVLPSHREQTRCAGQCLMTLQGNLVRSKPSLSCPDVLGSLEHQAVGETLSKIVLGHFEGTLVYPKALGKKSGKLRLPGGWET